MIFIAMVWNSVRRMSLSMSGGHLYSIDIIAASPAECAGIAMLVDRSGGQMAFEVPVRSILEITLPTYPPDQLPPELSAVPVEKPGS